MDETTTVATTSEKITSSTYWENKFDEALKWITTNGIKMLLALIVLFIAFKIVNVIARRIRKNMVAKKCDPTFTVIIVNLFRKGIKIILFVAYLAYIGLDTASIGAVIASCGVGIGLALQGSLSNLAGGIIIVIVRPFRLGDYIEAQGEGGTVEDIRIFYTYIVTPDNRTVMIPNGVLANGVIRNNSMKDRRRVDFNFSVSYKSDLKLVKDYPKARKKVPLFVEYYRVNSFTSDQCYEYRENTQSILSHLCPDDVGKMSVTCCKCYCCWSTGSGARTRTGAMPKGF